MQDPEVSPPPPAAVCGKAIAVTMDGVIERCSREPIHRGKCADAVNVLPVRVYLRADQTGWLEEEASRRGGERMKSAIVREAIDMLILASADE